MEPLSTPAHPIAEAPRPAEARVSDAGKAKTLFFTAAFLSLLVSVYLYFTGSREQGIFVGLWVPSILSAGTLILAGARHD